MSALAPTLEAFFSQRLIAQRDASPRTVAAYRDTWRLLLGFASEQTGKQPCQLDIADLDAPLIGAFLDHLEAERGNSPRTRNARLAAIHSFYRFASLRHPEHAQTIARVIEIPPKRLNRPLISYLDEHEIKALLAEISNGSSETIGSYSSENAKRVKEFPHDRAELARKSLPYERLDQLTVDILFGVR